jgi:hypothetical protein
MKTMKHNLRNLVLVAVAALLSATTFTAVGTFGQKGGGPATVLCPVPKHLTLTATNPSVNTADFPTNCSAGFEQNLNGTTPDRCYIHTFNVELPELCCQCIESKKNFLTIRYTALKGQPGNDQWNILGSSGVHGWLYDNGTSQPPPGTTGTKTIPLTCAMLKNKPLRLSILLQDDSSVTSATLDVDLCCVSTGK